MPKYAIKTTVSDQLPNSTFILCSKKLKSDLLVNNSENSFVETSKRSIIALKNLALNLLKQERDTEAFGFYGTLFK